MNHLSTRLLLLAAPGLLATSALASYSPDWQEYRLNGESSRQLGDNLIEVTYELSARDASAPYRQLRVYRRFDWKATKLDALLRFARHGLWSLGAALALALILVTHNTIRLQVLARRDEIEVSKLIGATDDFIRRPFLYHALWQGVFAALIAWGLSYWFVQAASPALAELAALYGARTTLAPLGLAEGGILVLCSALLCMLGARLAASHHLRQLAPR